MASVILFVIFCREFLFMSTPKLTGKAVAQIKKVLLENGMDVEKTFVRVGIKGMSCSGPSYAFGFDDEFFQETDNLSSQDGLSVVNSKEFGDYLAHIEIDYVENESEKSGFTFRNTNPLQVMADGANGCGSGGGCCGGGGCGN